MSNCCVQSVPPDSSYKAFGQPVQDWRARLTAGLNRSIAIRNQTMGDLERQILQQTQSLERKLLEEASQKKAGQSPPVCPVCGQPLSRLSPGHERTYQTRFGPVSIRRPPWLVSAMQSVAFSGRLCVRAGGHRQCFALRPGDGGVGGQQDAGERSQRGVGTFDRGKAAGGDAGSGSPAAGQAGRAQTQGAGPADEFGRRR